eukprot:8413880-Pyramimonas_sp.AAC.1
MRLREGSVGIDGAVSSGILSWPDFSDLKSGIPIMAETLLIWRSGLSCLGNAERPAFPSGSPP